MGGGFGAPEHHHGILSKTLKFVVSSIFWEYIHGPYIHAKFW
jgi:hypothetical protein